ncbi:MAG: PQQ-binding-like beta-propeller repeat protein [Blastocatellia bacterium]
MRTLFNTFSLMVCFLLLIFIFPRGDAARTAAPPADPAHWPQWRGPANNGVARTGAPVEFSDAKNVKWKMAIPGRGFSTPIIWGDKIFLTTAVPTGKTAAPQAAASAPRPEGPPPGAGGPPAGGPPGGGRRGGPGGGPGGPGGGAGSGEEQKLVVMCLDRKTGKTLWEQTPKIATPHEGHHQSYGSFASQSPITDGKFLYVSFGSRGLYCYDMNGKLVWEKDPGVQMRMRLGFGEGTAPVLSGNLLIHTYDQEGGSQIIAFDKRNGKEVWRQARDEASTWATPLVIDFKGKKQLIVSGTRKVRAYEPDSGKVIWECAGLGLNVIPMPQMHNDTILVMSGFRDPKLMSIRLGREGDLSNTDAVLWSQTRGLSYTPSPLLHDNKYYTLTDNGLFSCFNATTGEPYYQTQRLPQQDSFKASPTGADGKIYLASESGVVTVVKMGEKFETLATNTLENQMFVSSPVIAEGELYLRSKTHLFCISEKR